MIRRKKNEPEPSGQDIIKAIQDGKETALISVYRIYRKGFVAWALQHYKVGEADVADVFQEAVIAFYKKAIFDEKFTLTSSLKTYLYGIGKNLLLKIIEGNKPLMLNDQFDELPSDNTDDELPHRIEKNHRQQVIADALAKLGEKCQQLLRLYYFHSFSHEAIALRMGYSDEGTSRNRKSKCLKELAKYLEKDKL